MPRPKNKQDLVTAAQTQYDKLWALIGTRSDDVQHLPFSFIPEEMGKEAHWKRDKNIRDVFVHLHEWHRLLLDWVERNQSGTEAPFLPAPYNWRTYGDMNVQLWSKHQSTPYQKSIELLHDSHNEVLRLIEDFSDEQLFEKGQLSWTGGSTLGQYCVSVTSSHYDWAMKKIKAHRKACQSASS